MVVAGTIAIPPTERAAGTGHVSEFRLASGRAGSKTGRLWIDVEHWHRESEPPHEREALVVGGSLAYGRSPSCESSRYYLQARAIAVLPSTDPAD